MSCGDSHSGAVDSDGRVFTWGSYKGSSGHLGYTAETSKQTVPKLMDKLPTGSARVWGHSNGTANTPLSPYPALTHSRHAPCPCPHLSTLASAQILCIPHSLFLSLPLTRYCARLSRFAAAQTTPLWSRTLAPP
jgi:hypothetical protein